MERWVRNRPIILIDCLFQDVYQKVEKVLAYLRNYWDEDYPLCKLDIVALPAGFSSLKPVDNWGLIVFK